jgi:hypothetical protein
MMDALASDEPALLTRSLDIPTGQTIDEYTPQDGDHLCSLWTNPQHDRRTAKEFLRSSSDRAALWIRDPSRGLAIGRSPGAEGVTETDAEATGRVCSTRDVYLPDGTFNPERLYRFWKERIEEMSGQGRRRVRIVAEMEWMLEDRAGTESAAGYESGLNRVLAASPAAVICQYGSTRFRLSTVLAMLLSHPRVVIGRRVFANPFCVADEAFPALLERLSADPIASLIPMWRHYLQRLPDASEVGAFLVNSLAAFIAADTVTVQITGQPHGWHLETDGEVLREIEPDGSGSRAASHLFAFWPSGGSGLGGSVHAGTHDGVSWVEASFDEHPHCLLLSRRQRFERGELMAFTTLVSWISSALPRASRFA